MWWRTKKELAKFQVEERLSPTLKADAQTLRRARELSELACKCAKDIKTWADFNKLHGVNGDTFNYFTALELNDLSHDNKYNRNLSNRDADKVSLVGKDVKVTDDPYPEQFLRSPNQSGVITPELIMLHHSYGSYKGGISWIRQVISKVSYHYLIDVTGHRTQLVWDKLRAWHAGKSYWDGKTNLNGTSIGIAVTGNTNKRKLTKAEVDSVAYKIIYLATKFSTIKGVVTHRDVAPKRKNDVDVRAEKAIKDKVLSYRPDLQKLFK